MKKYDVDPVLGVLALAHANKIDFSFTEKSGWFTCNFEISIVYDLRALKDPGRSIFTYPAVPVCYSVEYCEDVMGVASAQRWH